MGTGVYTDTPDPEKESERGSRVHSPMPYHAGFHHPGSLRWPCDQLLIPVDAVFSWSRMLGSPSDDVKVAEAHQLERIGGG